jgi:hypothetical protein
VIAAKSLQLWDALHRPPIHHPLFRRAARQPEPYSAPPRSLSRARRWVLLLGGGVLAAVAVVYFTQLIVMLIFFVPLACAAVYMILFGTASGMYWALRVSGAIARERERGTYELLSTSPYGPFSASWAVCTGCQYYDQTFKGVGAQRVWYARAFFLTMLLFSAIAAQVDPRNFGGRSLETLVGVTVIAFTLALAFYMDDVQSTVTGSLVGMIVPQFTRNRLDARVGAFVGFVLLQASVYLLVWWASFSLLPQINEALGVRPFIVLPCEQVLAFFAIREVVIRVLWGMTTLLFAGDVSDLRLLSKGGRLIC